MILQQFIDAGFYTVPLGGRLDRGPDGKKNVPKFESNWNKKYAENFNTKATPLGGALTGAVSGFVAVDCDNQATYDLFRELDPDNTVLLPSKGKPEGGGTLLYKYDSELTSFSLSDGSLALDFYADGGFIYLPTENNSTKEPWPFEEVPPLSDMPQTAKALLKTLALKQVPKKAETPHNSPAISNRLAPMLEEFVKNGAYSPVLFRIITPKSFRDLPKYVKQGHMHPEDVPVGRGSEYLSRISAILGADISVSKELYQNAMQCINALWPSHMESKRFLQTVINPMIEEKVMIDDKVVWQYDRHWQKMGFIATAMNGEYVESFFDDVKGLYYLVNYTVPYIKTFVDKSKCISVLKTIIGRGITEVSFDSTKQLCRTQLVPQKPFGHVDGSDVFNLFRQTPELDVLNYPDSYAIQYKRPDTILKYFETLIPDDYMRGYVLSFVKTKLTTFRYSPVILYFIGKHGSGKDTFVNILTQILGNNCKAKPTAKVFLEMHNGWILDKFIAHLDEYGDALTKSSDREQALGLIKTYSGSPEVQIRAMRTDAFNYRHSITFIMTANNNPLPLDIQDRRIAFISTPNRLHTQEWVEELGGIVKTQDLIASEIMDFCYYLATEVESLHLDRYMIAPETDDKQNMIAESLPDSKLIAYLAMNGKFEQLEQLFIDNSIGNYAMGWGSGRLDYEKLRDLYLAMTEHKGQERALMGAMKACGMSRKHTTRRGQNVFFYEPEGLHLHKPKSGGSEFVEQAGNFKTIQPEGL